MTEGAATVRTIGRYALYQAIASGGMATVYVGRLLGPVGFARTVAVKRLHPHYAADRHFTAMFVDEARLAARIRHPNVVPTVDVVATQGELYLVMEYVHGESLSKLVRGAAEEGAPMPVPVVVATLSGALQGLAAAHDAKSERGEPLQIIHRDVSPQNILLGLDGQARLIDFGVARSEGRLHTTQTGQVKGKIAYMSPEQLRGEEIGPTTDVYAAGVVLWESLTGQRLFHAEGDGGLVVQVLEARIDPPSLVLRRAGDEGRAEAVAPLDAVVLRAVSKAKDDRFQTARDFARALEGAVPPATAAQVSDWVEGAAATVLRARAELIAQIENESAHDLTTGEFRSAMERGAGIDSAVGSAAAPPASSVAPVTSGAPSLEAVTVALPPRGQPEPSVRAPLFIEGALAERAAEPHPRYSETPALPMATLVSVVAPTGGRAVPASTLPAHLSRTLESPIGTKPARRALDAPEVPAAEASTRVPGLRRRRPWGVWVALGLFLVALALLVRHFHGHHR